MNDNRPLKVFLCHSSGEKAAVRKLYRYLLSHGVDAGLDEERLLPGQDGTIFIIPSRLEECELPYRLKPNQLVDLFANGGREKLIKALELHY